MERRDGKQMSDVPGPWQHLLGHLLIICARARGPDVDPAVI